MLGQLGLKFKNYVLDNKEKIKDMSRGFVIIRNLPEEIKYIYSERIYKIFSSKKNCLKTLNDLNNAVHIVGALEDPK